MAVRLSVSGHEVSDLCLGKPSLRSISITDTIADALSAIKLFGLTYLSVWNCHHSVTNKKPVATLEEGDLNCECVGRVCMVDVICFLCKPENLSSPCTALQSPVSVLFEGDNYSLVQHIQPNASLLEAIDAMDKGVQNVVIPIPEEKRWKKKENQTLDSDILHNDNRAYCWLSQEDVMRYLLNSIRVFSPSPATDSILTLGIIDTENLFVLYYNDPASSALELLTAAIVHQSSVAVVNPQGKLIGEISPFMLNSFDEAVAPALATLSVGDVLTYIDCGGPPEDLVQLVKERLYEQNYSAAVELLGEETTLPSWPSFSSTSSEEDTCKNWKLGGYSSRVVRRSEAIFCYPWSSLVAVMIQALAHRVSYVWVVQEDGTLTGIVTFQGMLKIFREHL
ncbi:CBS domain-containing protein CBSX5-like [Vicia villosa]|uniref:CBS domain-containing protein CBSX5-like n=1 Tax=Vicia villosa TaxID=3911 RepID=UPI00273A93E3|nr:CBS domain-containing protein CBSX5-like [Vicia villosa]